LLLLNFCEIK